MKLGIRGTALAAMAGLSALVPIALAQGSSAADRIRMSSRNDGWMAIQLAPGCHLIAFIDDFVFAWGGFDDLENLRFTTSGRCNANGLAEGPVQLTYEWKAETGPVRVVREATAQDGILQGMSNRTVYSEPFDKPGTFELHDFGDGRNPMPSFFRDGCKFFVDYDGRIDFGSPSAYPPYDQCLAEGRQFLLDAALAPSTDPAPVAPVPPPLAAAAPPPAGNADVWSRCINLTQYPRDGGIQTVWALNNTCNTTVIARFCFRAEYEAAGDPNLCRRREMRTQEIRPGASYDFPFSLIPPGTGLTDGRVVRSNELLVSGFACTGGNFPKAYFDNDGAFRSDGC